MEKGLCSSEPSQGLGAEEHSHRAPLALLPDMTGVCFGPHAAAFTSPIPHVEA